MGNENITRMTIHTGQRPTEAQVREIERAKAYPFVFDSDAPELTAEQYAEMSEIVRRRQTGAYAPLCAG